MLTRRPSLAAAGATACAALALWVSFGALAFVADLTFTGTRPDGRLTPNPNVLIEYGWVLKTLGYSQVLAVMNAAYGTPTRESLPFDLASLRFPIVYELPEDASESVRRTERDQLARKIETALRTVFESEEFKAKVVAAARKPGVSIAAIALANRLNANLLRRWVVAEEQAQPTKPARALAPVAVRNRRLSPARAPDRHESTAIDSDRHRFRHVRRS